MNDTELLKEIKMAEIARILTMDAVLEEYVSTMSADSKTEADRIRAAWMSEKDALQAWVDAN